MNLEESFSSDDELTRALEGYETFHRTPDCASIERLCRLAEGELEEEESQRLHTHAATCPRCRAELVLARSFFDFDARPEAAGEPDLSATALPVSQRVEPIPLASTSRTQTSRSWQWAAALLIAAVGLLGYQQLRPSTPALQLPDGASIVRSATVETIRPSGRLDVAPKELQWVALPEAERYRAEIFRVDRSVVWSTEVTQARAEIPSDVSSELRSKTRYNWRVTASDAKGHVMASSASIGFMIEPAAPSTKSN